MTTMMVVAMATTNMIEFNMVEKCDGCKCKCELEYVVNGNLSYGKCTVCAMNERVNATISY